MTNIQDDFLQRQKLLHESSTEYSALMIGLHALSLDFEFYRRIPFGSSRITDIHEEIRHRLGSCEFQFDQLVRYLNDVQFKTYSPDSIVKSTPLPLLMKSYQTKVSFLIENIIFNITALYDYFSILVNYVIAKTDDTLDWNKLQNFARNNTGAFYNNNAAEVKNILLEIHKSFVDKLYKYRSELIHRKSDVVKCDGSLDYKNDRINIEFYCTSKQLDTFSITNDQTRKYSINYLAKVIFDQSIIYIIKIIRALRNFQLKLEIDENKPMQGAFQLDENNKPISSAGPYWALFDSILIFK